MKKKAGIWIDSKQAVVVYLTDDGHSTKTINSMMEGQDRTDGEGKEYTRMGNQFMDAGKKKDARKLMQVKAYLKEVADEITDAGEIVLFGPAEMKNELAKYIKEDLKKSSLIKAVETADSMTENQMAAWVKKFYN